MRTQQLLVGLFAMLALFGGPLASLTAVAQAQNPNTLYVDADSTAPSPDGMSWGTAFNKLQDALAAARGDATVEEIWVAAGVYYPDEGSGQTPDDRAASFDLVDDVELYGGFTGDETNRNDRNPDPATNGTILSGDITQDDDNTDGNFINETWEDITPVVETAPDDATNSDSVVTSSDTGAATVLDGFIITAGYARDGGGIENTNSSATFRNLLIIGNRAIDDGGGVFNQAGSPTFTQVVIRGNQADRLLGGNGGGGVFNGSSVPAFTNVVVSGNSAVGNGGGIYNRDDTANNQTPLFVNVLLSGNLVSQDMSDDDGHGGGMYNAFIDPLLVNVTISGNRAEGDGGGVYNVSSVTDPVFQNSIIWGNAADGSGDQVENTVPPNPSEPSYTFTLVQGSGGSGSGWDTSLGIDGGNNIDGNPQFVNARLANQAPTAEGDYRIEVNSPVIDQGDSNVNDEAFDLAGSPRQIDGDTDGTITIDLGAYEFQTFVPDDPDTGVAFSTTTINASEDGDTDSYDVVLQQQPTADVTVTIITDAQTSIVQPAQPVLTFTPSDWDVPQTVTVRAVDDSDREGPHTGTVLHTVASSELGAATLPIADVTVDITDNDAPGLVVNALSVSVTEGSTTDAYTVALNSPPTADVSVEIDAGTQLATDAQPLTFTPDNWDTPQTITVTAVDDGDEEGNHSGAIAHSTTSSDSGYSGLTADVDVDIADNDADDPTGDPGNPSNPGSPTDQATVFLPFVAQ